MEFWWLAYRVTAPLLDRVLPPSCSVCRRRGSWLCTYCQRRIGMRTPSTCPRCDHPTGSGETSCPDCLASNYIFEQARSLGEHAGLLRELVLDFKYRGRWQLALPLGQRLAGLAAQTWPHRAWDAVLGVPSEPMRVRRRGYDQAALLARVVAAELGSPYLPQLLRRKATGLQQGRLGVLQRRQHARSAYGEGGHTPLEYQSILLVDDVFTTGATLDACARVLARRGARVWCVTLARGRSLQAPLCGPALEAPGTVDRHSFLVQRRSA